ncbi:MAG: hypothetical protein GEU74_01275 [Nitriliruptorales bacterium]|nr:hypothetical protein [Nitriliruptorales bacterium]
MVERRDLSLAQTMMGGVWGTMLFVGAGVANGIVGLLPAFALLRFGSSDAGIGTLLAARGLGR